MANKDLIQIVNMGKTRLRRLREDITLGSLFIRDYENRYGLDPHVVCAFFEGFETYIEEMMLDDGFTDADYLDKRPEYDTLENLVAWQGCYAVLGNE